MTDGELESIIRRHVGLTLQMFRRDGTMHMHAMVIGYDGRMVGLSAMLLRDDDAFPGAVRELAEDLEALAIVTVLEGWAAETPAGDWPTHIPSEAPDRQEVLIITIETWKDTRMRVWPIQRDSCEVSLGDEMDNLGDCVGRFTGFLRRAEHN